MRQSNEEREHWQHTELSRTGAFPLFNFPFADGFLESRTGPTLLGGVLDCEAGRFDADEVEGVGSD